MIRMQADDLLFCIIEPGNLNRLKDGKPMVIDLAPHPGVTKIGFAFTPDGPFVERALQSLYGASGHIDIDALDRVLKEASAHTEVTR